MADLRATLERYGVDTSSLRMHGYTDRSEIFVTLIVPGEEAFPLWESLRGIVAERGHWPLILGNEAQVGDLLPNLFSDSRSSASPADDDRTPSEIIVAGLQLDPQRWFEDRYAQSPDYRRERWAEVEDGYGFEHHEQHGQRIELTAEALYGSNPTQGIPAPPLYVALLPVAAGWQAPAFLGFGGFNECPFPEEHVCILRWWDERYGAEPVLLLADSLYLRVARPPRDRTVALALAREHLIYCDSIEEASEIESLAGLLNHATAWRFWWD